jgi:hypothetical protein
VFSTETPRSCSTISAAKDLPSIKTILQACCLLTYSLASFVKLAVVIKAPFDAPCPVNAPTNF